MTRAHGAPITLRFVAAAACVLLCATLAHGVGVNWGTMASHIMLPSTVVEMIKANNIKKVKLFDADPWTVSAFAGTGIQVMVAIPNDMLHRMSKDYDNAKDWVKENVTRHLYDGGVDIRYVAVGNEPFLKSYNGSFMKDTFPALQNVQKALDEAGIGKKIKATIPLNADVYESPGEQPVPSTGNFRSDIRPLMQSIVKFLHSNNAPFVVNIYPFLSLYDNPDFPVDFAFLDDQGKSVNDNGKTYNNVLDANYDTLVWSLKRAGVPDLKIIIGEVGWPTDGDKQANVQNAKRFYDGLFKKLASNKGTPLRPGPLDVYLFGLLDEDQKSVAPGNFERHWGIFRFDGRPKFPVDFTGRGNDRYLVGAKGVQYLEKKWCVFNKEAQDLSRLGNNVEYACSRGDCTALGYGSSCNGLDALANASYAFNMYFQIQDQDVEACVFEGLAKISSKNMSQGDCLFPIQIESGGERLFKNGTRLASIPAQSIEIKVLSAFITMEVGLHEGSELVEPDIGREDDATESCPVKPAVPDDSIAVTDKETEKVVPKVDGIVLEPYVGLEFESLESARSFYSSYAKRLGFGTRVSYSHRSRRERNITAQQYVCSMEGFSPSTSEGPSKQTRAGISVGCHASMTVKRAGPTKWVVKSFEKSHNHDLANLTQLQMVQAFKELDAVGGHVRAMKVAEEGARTAEGYRMAMWGLHAASEQVAIVNDSVIGFSQPALVGGGSL
ncbi:hypothetical protein H6P81_001369 [Aristolochia fimbriata]|uniref:glucan endo-1,3-beta-D-glucosidase n=1 Tax=Aristolochia fimbriata TaxID=158543 RepID=A0AAV7F7X3_ARIFI|nr:hypothetical protein H6P81_001369 [Aristolochia fimbriata]